MSLLDLKHVLEGFSASSCNYDEWCNVGFALQHEGYDCSVWDSWSAEDTKRYHPGECAKKWRSFRGTAKPVTGATLMDIAKSHGWKPEQRHHDNDHEIGFSDVITDDEEPERIVDFHYLQGIQIREPSVWNPKQQIINYLRTLFDPDDVVGYVNESKYVEKADKYIPANSGSFDQTAGKLIAKLEKYPRIQDAMGDYDTSAGMWIRFNPLDGKGVTNDNVVDYRYTLVESDSMPIDKQNEIFRQLELPIAALVYSGGKSVHAIVHIDADSMEEYRKRVEFLYKTCEKNGLQVDKNDRNPSRLSRLPGIERGKNKQFIIDTNIGKSSWDEWKDWFESVTDDLPDFTSLSSVWDNIPDLAPPLIDGVLRQGHKMLLAGEPKAGKSFLLSELCIAVGTGTPWIGFPCAKGKVLYVNLELDEAQCLNRFHDIISAMHLPNTEDAVRNIDIWNLRGKALPLDKLAPKMIRRAIKQNYLVIVIDPIYKIITGDENSADQMAYFCNQFDKICTELKCSVVYCHHHSKGSQWMKRSMDRASGSGVFSRDADALLDMTRLEIATEKWGKDPDGNAGKPTAWRIEGTLREYASFEPRNIWFRYPIHTLDDTGMLKFAAEEGDMSAKALKAAESKRNIAEQKKIGMDDAYNMLVELEHDKSCISLEKMAEYMQLSTATCKKYATEKGFIVKNNKIYRKEEGKDDGKQRQSGLEEFKGNAG